MGRLVMSFQGLCLNLQEELPADVGHRIVAVDASEAHTTKHWGWLPPHRCFVELLSFSPQAPGADVASVTRTNVDGFRLTLRNARPTELSVDLTLERPSHGFTEIPHLPAYDPSMRLRPDLLEPGPPRLAAGFVDIVAGRITASSVEEGAMYTTWTVDTDGDPELLLTPRVGEPMVLPLPSTPSGAVFPNGIPGSVLFHNSTIDREHKKFDFVLHYLAAEHGIPEMLDPDFPHDDRSDPASGLTTSCSNSQYP